MNGKREEIALGARDLTLQQVVAVARGNPKVVVEESARKHIAATSEELKNKVEAALTSNKENCTGLELKQKMIYGTTTGFGDLKTRLITKGDRAKELQENIIMSHASGVGPLFDRETTRAIMLVRSNTLATGYCGVSLEIVDQLLAMLENDIWPSIPEQGSVGASGDLAPLAHLALGLVGKGEVNRRIGDNEQKFPRLAQLIEADPELKGIKSEIKLSYKEGLALVNGLAVMTAIGSLAHADAMNLVEWADVIGAVTLESLLGSSRAFDDIVFTVYGHEGAKTTAKRIQEMIKDSELINRCNDVHDSYSLRCMPQIHGAARDAFGYVQTTLANQLKTIDDDPIFFSRNEVDEHPPIDSLNPPKDHERDDQRTSGAGWKNRLHFEQGNFHGEPIAFAMDLLAIAIAEIANVSERRIQMLLDKHHNRGLPAFLVDSPDGVNSGYMIAQYTAAALVSENKHLCHPASVDSIPTSANSEDHVSMGTIAARKARKVVENVKNVLAIELLCATEALSYRLSEQTNSAINPKFIRDKCGTGTQLVYNHVRKQAKAIEFLGGKDKILHEFIKKAREILSQPPTDILGNL